MKIPAFEIINNQNFEAIALNLFQWQAAQNPVYQSFINALGINPVDIQQISEIPFLPVSFFKTHRIITGHNAVQQEFKSSGTTGIVQSVHPVTDISVYEESYRRGFSFFYGDIKRYRLLALLPSYQEREGSSLIYMINDLMNQSGFPENRFYLEDTELLAQTLQSLHQAGHPVILWGVTYALLDFAERYRLHIPNALVIETGGMKGRKKEMVREEVHERLCERLGVSVVHSEYGMSELLSQAYSKGHGLFYTPPWMKVLIRDVNDPMSFIGDEKAGGVNIIDLANVNSCAFIATQDLGKSHTDGGFEIIGRFDNSDIRGCNLLIN